MGNDLSVRAVAAELGLTIDTVRRLLAAGDLPGYKVDRRGTWRVQRLELDAFKARGGVRSQGRPRKDRETNG